MQTRLLLFAVTILALLLAISRDASVKKSSTESDLATLQKTKPERTYPTPFNGVEAIVQSWQKQADKLQTLALTIEIEFDDVCFKQKKILQAEAKLLQKSDGTQLLRFETYEPQAGGKKKLQQKIIIAKGKVFQFDPSDKSVRIMNFDPKMNQTLFDEMSDFCFAMVPFVGFDPPTLQSRFTMSVQQQDEHYTWLRFLPKSSTDQRCFTIAQIGVVNYDNALSSKYFPLHILWREPNNNTQRWKTTKISRNDPSTVSINDFEVQPIDNQNNDWKIYESKEMPWFIKWFFGWDKPKARNASSDHSQDNR